jgi:hypothetical protein
VSAPSSETLALYRWRHSKIQTLFLLYSLLLEPFEQFIFPGIQPKNAQLTYCANSPLARIGAQVPDWLYPMPDKQTLLPAGAGGITYVMAA